MYSIEKAFSDSDLATAYSDNQAYERLGEFIDSLSQTDIRTHYLELARLFWKLPFGESVSLAHVVIERHLLEEDAFPDIFIWAFSTLRQVPLADTAWITRNYLALALQALGYPDRAEQLLTENWMSLQAGSLYAHAWLFGVDASKSATQRSLDAISGKSTEPEVKFRDLRASWLDPQTVESVRSEVSKGLESSTLTLDSIDDSHGLTYWLLKSAEDSGVASSRNNALWGLTLAVFAHLRLDDSEFLLGSAAKAKLEGKNASVSIDYLSIAAFLMNDRAYIPLARTLKEAGLMDQALGYANVAVWKNLEGSADIVISLLGLDGIELNLNGLAVDEETKVSMYKMAAGMA